MNARRYLIGLAVTTTALVMSSLPAAGAQADRPSDDPATTATRHLRADATGGLVMDSQPDGRVRFIGTPARAEVDNPDVDKADSVREAARAHLNRYGAALGAAQGSGFVQRSVSRAVSGVDMVRFAQTVSEVPVLGGDVVLGLGPDRDLRSLSADVSSAARFTDATLTPDAVERTALGLVRRAHRHADLTVTDLGRWVLDPAVAGLEVPGGVRTVRRLEVADRAAGVRQLVLVDDHSGRMAFQTSLIEQSDRVVCDRNNIRGAETPCTSGFARTEGQGPTGVTDVDQAYDFSGATSAFYQQVGGLDLTALLGIDVSGVKKLASTVRFCTSDLGDPCPFPNAYWDGVQMFYGSGFAAADDVVGHEMTHGVVDQYSKLFYWGQSGAINESLADTIGEIVDHRTSTPGDSPTNWDLGEDLAGGPLRNMADPTTYSDPDKMTSAFYDSDVDYSDGGGVHTNSGVGNKTAYLISQGGTFNGQTITGIDAGDPNLTKTGKLYVDVIESLASGADYAALAHVLDQSCADLLTAGAAGFTAANCTAVHQAGVATELTTNSPKALHATDAPITCPDGTTKRVLLDSETDPATKFAPFDTGWSRESAAGTTNATSGTDSWYAEDPGGSTPSSAWIETNPLRSSSSIALPAGQQSFLSFENWYLLDYDSYGYYDGGTVELGLDGGVPTIGSTNSATWINGPNHTLASGYGNTAAGQPAYAGDSRGWSVSRLDLTPYAGHTVRPQFTMRSDNQYGFIGWYLDDIRIYTCDPVPPPPPPVPSAPTAVSVTGFVDGVTIRWSPPSSNAELVTGYSLGGWGGSVNLPATARSYVLRGIPRWMMRFQVNIAAMTPDSASPWVRVDVRRAVISLAGKRTGIQVAFKGKATRWHSTALAGQPVKLQRFSAGRWRTVTTLKTRRDGTYAITIRRAARANYRVLFAGTTNVVGSVSSSLRR
jgi:bacillolysin